MSTERAEKELWECLGIVSPTTTAVPMERTCARDPLAKQVLELDETVDEIFFDPETRPGPPMLVHLLFEGGFIEIFRAPTGTTGTKLSIDGRSSRFGRGNDAHGEVGSATYSAVGIVPADAGCIARIRDDLEKAFPRIAAALSNPPEGSSIICKPTLVSAAGR